MFRISWFDGHGKLGWRWVVLSYSHLTFRQTQIHGISGSKLLLALTSANHASKWRSSSDNILENYTGRNLIGVRQTMQLLPSLGNGQQGHWVPYNKFQSIPSYDEAWLYSLGIRDSEFSHWQDRQLFIMSFLNHVSNFPNARQAPHAISPAIHAFNFPPRCQRANDSAIFKIKPHTACMGHYNHNN